MSGEIGGVSAAAADNETRRRRVVNVWNLKDERWLNLELLSKVLTIPVETLKKGDSTTSLAWFPIDGALFFCLLFLKRAHYLSSFLSKNKIVMICAVHMKFAALVVPRHFLNLLSLLRDYLE